MTRTSVGTAAVTTSSHFERNRARYGSKDLESALGFCIAISCLGAVLTCVKAPAPQRGSSPVSAQSVKLQTAVVPEISSSDYKGSPPTKDSVSPNSLEHFRTALSKLAAKKLDEPLRVMWLGDSHTAGIFWPSSVESTLLSSVAPGGPGYLPLGLNYGRYHGARISSDESFNIAPHPPARRSPEDDGVFGLGGTRVTPRDRQLGLTIKLDPALANGRVKCQLLYRYQRSNDRLAVVIDGRNVEAPSYAATTLPQGMRLQTFEMDAQATLEIRTVAGNPELFGLVVENELPGLVIDVLGINGARFATPLAWDEESWKSLVKWRHPTLVVIAYGTNEVFDLVAPKRYRSDIQRLMDRIRSAISDFDCVIAGPTDVGKGGQVAEDRAVAIDQVENEAAEQLGCTYFSAYRAMGGAQGFEEWLHRTPALALPDRIHLTAAGYRRLGQLMGNTIVGSQ